MDWPNALTTQIAPKQGTGQFQNGVAPAASLPCQFQVLFIAPCCLLSPFKHAANWKQSCHSRNVIPGMACPKKVCDNSHTSSMKYQAASFTGKMVFCSPNFLQGYGEQFSISPLACQYGRYAHEFTRSHHAGKKTAKIECQRAYARAYVRTEQGRKSIPG